MAKTLNKKMKPLVIDGHPIRLEDIVDVSMNGREVRIGTGKDFRRAMERSRRLLADAIRDGRPGLWRHHGVRPLLRQTPDPAEEVLKKRRQQPPLFSRLRHRGTHRDRGDPGGHALPDDRPRQGLLGGIRRSPGADGALPQRGNHAGRALRGIRRGLGKTSRPCRTLPQPSSANGRSSITACGCCRPGRCGGRNSPIFLRVQGSPVPHERHGDHDGDRRPGGRPSPPDLDAVVGATALTVHALRGKSSHFHAPAGEAKPHPGRSRWPVPSRPPGNKSGFVGRGGGRAGDPPGPYSVRCVPQVVGVLADALAWIVPWIETEANSANDNPNFRSAGGPPVMSGNFYGGHIAFAADALKTAVASVADLSDRQVALR